MSDELTVDVREVGRYRVRVVVDHSMDGTGYYHSRDMENVGRMSVPGERDAWYFQDDRLTYREAREQAGEPILAIPLDIWEQSYCLLRVSHSWDGADGFYWAPISRAEEWPDGVVGLRACMVAEIEALAAELEGSVYGWVVERIGTAEEVESCWGYIGEADYAMSEGVSTAEWLNLRDAINWASLPEWVQRAVMIREEVTA